MKSEGLIPFHAMTGTDTISAFRGKGKVSAWQAWESCPEVSESFTYFALNPFPNIDSTNKHFLNMQKFVINMYSKKSKLAPINELWQDIFCHKSQNLENLSPTENALLQHT